MNKLPIITQNYKDNSEQNQDILYLSLPYFGKQADLVMK